ncbi:hypothetical protein PN492_01325 [Dolichospermum circinale CS-537/01]|uniref:Uncharacterized protein n=1 Tax=Dolichospermum circinale CS-537/01 TaxID=3021739 RepID=A0ABT5A0V7_9CYAN|nr:hypothetical protein [Dolichospermum circinale CS-537/01]
MRKLVLTSRFQRSLRKFIRHDQNLQARIEETRSVECRYKTLHI